MKSELQDNIESIIEIKLNSKNYVKGIIPSGERVLTLFDSGATKSLISLSTVKSSKYLSSLEHVKVNPVEFKLGNGNTLLADKVIKFSLKIQAHNFKIVAYITPQLTGVDIILGTNTLGELNGVLDFKTNTFHIRPQ